MAMPVLLYLTAVMESSLTQSLPMRKESLSSSKVSYIKSVLTQGSALQDISLSSFEIPLPPCPPLPKHIDFTINGDVFP